MQLPEIYVDSNKICGGSREDIVGYEHSVFVVMYWRRYDQYGRPQPAEGSPSRIEVGEETRHGALLTVSRSSLDPTPTPVEVAEMTGELAEAWVTMMWLPSRKLD